MPIQLSAKVVAKDGSVCGHISRLIANQSDRQIEAAVLLLPNGKEVAVPANAFSQDQHGQAMIGKSVSELEALPEMELSRYYALHPVEWQEEWGVVPGEILSLYPPRDKDLKSRRRFIAGSLALMGAVIAALAYPIARYLLHPLTKAMPRLWTPLKLHGKLKVDTPIFIPYDVHRVEGYLEETIRKGVWLIKPSRKLAAQIASRKVNIVFPDAGWANAVDGPVAFTPKCPHLGCNVRWVSEDKLFECACHNSRYSLDGRVIAGPAPRGMDTLPVRIDHGKIEIMDMEFRAGKTEKRRSA